MLTILFDFKFHAQNLLNSRTTFFHKNKNPKLFIVPHNTYLNVCYQ